MNKTGWVRRERRPVTRLFGQTLRARGKRDRPREHDVRGAGRDALTVAAVGTGAEASTRPPGRVSQLLLEQLEDGLRSLVGLGEDRHG